MKRHKYQSKVGHALYGGVFSLVGITLFSGLMLASTHVSADSVVTTATINVTASCSFSAGGGTYNISVNGNSSVEQTANPITTSCNDASGYAIYAIGYSNDSYTGTNTDLISSLGSSYNIKTDGSGTYGSSWRMMLTNPSNATIATGFDAYHDIPSTFTKVASYTSNTSAGSITPKYQITVNGSQPAGTYTGKVKYVLVHPNTAVAGQYTIAYNANGGSGTMASSTGIYNFEPFTLPDSTFTAPSGYQFAGWCTTQDQTQSPQTTCSGPLYSAGDEVTSLGTAGSTVNLYAVWEIDSRLYMQNVGAWGNTLSTGDEVTAIDTRDGKSYTVAKLADGNIWMTQNLDFDIVDAGADLDSTNTDVPSNWGDAGNLTDTYITSDTTWEYSYTTPASYDPGDLCWDGTIRSDYNGTLSTNASACGDDKHYSIGNYYNWTAAVAMSDSSSYTSEGTDVDQSICPAGWRLPNYSGTKNYSSLVSTLSLTSGTSGNIQNSPVYFVYGGNWDGSSYAVGGRGFYWSSVVGGDYYAYGLDFYRTGDPSPQGYVDRDYGYSVRCVAR